MSVSLFLYVTISIKYWGHRLCKLRYIIDVLLFNYKHDLIFIKEVKTIEYYSILKTFTESEVKYAKAVI